VSSSPDDRAIRYGATRQELGLPLGVSPIWIEPQTPEPETSAEDVVRRALRAPVGSPPLSELARGSRSAAILVPGKDRVAGAAACLPLVLEELNSAGIPDEAVEVTLATGTHAKHSPEDVRTLLGDEIAARVRCREHDCHDAAELRHIGTTTRGTDVLLDGSVLDADLKVLLGRIIPHYFAGFGGGRKAVLPGVSAFETIRHNHSLTLNGTDGVHPKVRPCSLDGNPVHLDMVEAARMVPGTFVLNTLLDTQERLVGAVAGELVQAHEAGCAEAGKRFRLTVDEPLDAIVTSAGGAPFDCNFMQALKAAFNVQEALRPGGSLLWIARCPDGMKEGFLEWARISADEELVESVLAGYNLTGHNSVMLRRLARRARVAFWSDLPDEKVRALRFTPVHSVQEGVEWLGKELPSGFRCGVVPFANVTHVTSAQGGGGP
jgi:nickel-dependent lactate racemase